MDDQGTNNDQMTVRDRWLSAICYVPFLVLLTMLSGDRSEFLARHTRQGFALLFVDAPRERRFERSRARARPGDPKTLAEFAAAERAQLASADPAGHPSVRM